MAMPEYAKGTTAAIAASKKEAELTKKVQATPLANAPKAAISNAAATANSNINKYDVAKADQAAKNAQQAKAVVSQIAKQAAQPQTLKEAFVQASPIVLPKTITSVVPPSDRPLASFMGDAAKRATQTTGAQQVGALNDVSLMAQQTYNTPSMSKAFEAALPSKELPLAIYMGEASKYPTGTDPYGLKSMTDATYGQVQKAVPSNIQPLGAQLGEVAKDVALASPATSASTQAQLQNLISSTYGEPVSTPTVTSTLFGDTLRAQQGISPASLVQPQGLGAPPIKTESAQPSAEKSPYVAMGEASKPVEKTPQQLAAEQAATASLAEQQRREMEQKPVAPVEKTPQQVAAEQAAIASLTEQQQRAKEEVVTAPPVKKEEQAVTAPPTTQARTGGIVAGTDKERSSNIPDGFKDQDGYTWNATSGQWESPEIWQNTVRNREAFRMASIPEFTADQRLGEIQAGINTATEFEKQLQSMQGMTPEEIQARFGEEPKVTTKPFGEPIVAGLENYPSQYAASVVDKQIADANRQIDLQTEEALRNRDLQTAQNLQAYKRAINEMRDTGFMQNQQLLQQMANRGMLTSGIAADAQTRLQMSMNQNIRDIAVKNQESQDKINADYKTAFDKLVQRREELASGRQESIDKIVKGIEADNREIQKLDLDYKKLQMEENKTLLNNAQDVLKRYADQGYDTTSFERYLVAGDVRGLAQVMAQSNIPQLSLIGKDMAAKIDETNSQIILNKRNAERAAMDTKQTLSQIDKQRSDTTGYIFMNGVMVKDSKGAPIRTSEAILNDRKMTDAEKRTAIAQTNAATARAKASQATSTKTTATTVPKPMSQSQQLNFLQDTISTLVIPKFEETLDAYGDTVRVKVGEELNPSNVKDFKEIMADLWASGTVNPEIIQNQYRAFGLTPPTLDDVLGIKKNPDR
jgi:hypothetical protein